MPELRPQAFTVSMEDGQKTITFSGEAVCADKIMPLVEYTSIERLKLDACMDPIGVQEMKAILNVLRYTECSILSFRDCALTLDGLLLFTSAFLPRALSPFPVVQQQQQQQQCTQQTSCTAQEATSTQAVSDSGTHAPKEEAPHASISKEATQSATRSGLNVRWPIIAEEELAQLTLHNCTLIHNLIEAASESEHAYEGRDSTGRERPTGPYLRCRLVHLSLFPALFSRLCCTCRILDISGVGMAVGSSVFSSQQLLASPADIIAASQALPRANAADDPATSTLCFPPIPFNLFVLRQLKLRATFFQDRGSNDLATLPRGCESGRSDSTWFRDILVAMGPRLQLVMISDTNFGSSPPLAQQLLAAFPSLTELLWLDLSSSALTSDFVVSCFRAVRDHLRELQTLNLSFNIVKNDCWMMLEEVLLSEHPSIENITVHHAYANCTESHIRAFARAYPLCSRLRTLDVQTTLSLPAHAHPPVFELGLLMEEEKITRGRRAALEIVRTATLTRRLVSDVLDFLPVLRSLLLSGHPAFPHANLFQLLEDSPEWLVYIAFGLGPRHLGDYAAVASVCGAKIPLPPPWIWSFLSSPSDADGSSLLIPTSLISPTTTRSVTTTSTPRAPIPQQHNVQLLAPGPAVNNAGTVHQRGDAFDEVDGEGSLIPFLHEPLSQDGNGFAQLPGESTPTNAVHNEESPEPHPSDSACKSAKTADAINRARKSIQIERFLPTQHARESVASLSRIPPLRLLCSLALRRSITASESEFHHVLPTLPFVEDLCLMSDFMLGLPVKLSS